MQFLTSLLKIRLRVFWGGLLQIITGQAWFWLHGETKDGIIKSFTDTQADISITTINNATHKQEVRGHVRIQ